MYWASTAQHIPTSNIDQEGFCAQDRLHDQKLQSDTAYAQQHAAMEAQILAMHRLQSGARLPEGFTLPVVFHIIHNNGPENISDDQVHEALQHLNDAFANVGYYDPSTGVDIQIDFCLAQRNPDGYATNGINRVQSSLTAFNFDTQDQELKDLSRWNARDYINIWIVEDICGNNGCDVAGYAFSPGAHGQPYDGIVVEAEFTGSSPANSTYLVHEMGHYLGLYHTFRNGCINEDCLSDGDLVCDTPPDNTSASPPCNLPPNSCSTDEDDTSLNNPFRAISLGGLGEQPDPIENYMDYSKRECYNQFTQGQKDRMQEVVDGLRSSLLQSLGCVEACPGHVNAAFSPNTYSTTLGGAIEFTNASINAHQYQWLIDGVEFSTALNAAYNFSNEGTFEITLIAYSDLDICPTDIYSLMVSAYCPVEAIISPGGMIVEPGDSVVFTSQSLNADRVSWQIEEVEVSNEPTYTLQTSTPGLYTLCLIAENDFCEDKQCVTIVANIPGTGTDLEICDNNEDEDGDGLIDCEDPDCPCVEDCSGTFVQILGLPGISQDNILISMAKTSDGGVLLGGASFALGTNLGYMGALTKITPEGTIAWARVLDFFGGWNLINCLELDDQGLIVGVDGNSNIFRYDPVNDTLLWSTHFPEAFRFSNIKFNPATGNYLSLGSRTGHPNVQEISQTTGEPIWERTFAFDNIEATNGLYQIALVDDFFYTLGGIRIDNNFWETRVVLSLFDPGGELAFSKYYFSSLTESNEQGGAGLLAESDGLICSIFGNAIGINSYRPYSAKLLKTDFSGNPIWAKQFFIENGSFQSYLNLAKASDGYYLYNYGYIAATESNNFILIKIDFEGNVLWSYSYGFENIDISQSYGSADGILEPVGSYLYFIGSIGIEEKGVVFKTNLDGTMDNDCDLLREINIIVEDITDPYVGDLSSEEVILSDVEPIHEQVEHWNRHYPFTYTCLPTVCDTFCLYDFTAHVDTTYCNGENLIVGLEICNSSDEFYEGGINIAFYNGNPTTNVDAAFLINAPLANLNLDSNTCQTFYLNIPYPETIGYVIINDNGGYLLPFDPENILPHTGITECDYSNNLDSFFYESIIPDLDLGPDVSICENSSLVLDAGPGFAEYRWNTGGTEQTYTVTGPGPYWVVATTACGEVRSDLIQVSLEASIALEEDSLWLCSGDSLVLSAPEVAGYAYQWYPGNNLACDTCTSITVSPESSVVYTLVANNENGCYSVDSVAVMLVEPPVLNLSDNITGCIPESGTLTVEILSENGPFDAWWSNGRNGHSATRLAPGEYTVTVTDFFGCQSVATAVVIVEEPEISAEINIDSISCFGETDGSIIVSNPSGGIAPYSYSLDGMNYQPSPIFEDQAAGQYQVWVRDAELCTALFPAELIEPDKLQVVLPQAYSINFGDSLLLLPEIFGGQELTYSWQPGEGLSCNDCPNPSASPAKTTQYLLHIQNTQGCTATATTTISVEQHFQVYIPSAFSPNGDGVNEIIRIYAGSGVATIRSFRIFSRWGEMVHEVKDQFPNALTSAWDGRLDGKPMPVGVYVYKAEVLFVDGTREVFEGDFLLMR
ncbi:MAG: hypothetical protein DHS20C18_20490 [Saprospiraceae bacterium]|nr:MAG: hypothetical protein DHS20C18_20490 [Saprospiraceae bacterium]